MKPLEDSHGRRFEYLRLSLEEACNFRCLYCLPNGYHKTRSQPPLTPKEIERLVRAFAAMGVWKVRLTGGEPTLRPDIVEIARLTASVAGVRRLALSTNGYRLRQLAPPLQEAGVGAVNVSVDSLNEERFARLTGRNVLPEVLEGIFKCVTLGLETKINVVMMKENFPDELEGFLELARHRPISVRFIELMRTGDNAALFDSSHVSSEGLASFLREKGWRNVERSGGDGPARRLRHPEFKGSLGIIAPYAKDFCSTCNRLRVTSRGELRLCLFSESNAPLRHLLQDDGDLGGLQRAIRDLLSGKKTSHELSEGRFGDAKNFAMMGG
jgi:cyclic pyranopterin phosphate synthase